ncbi:MAG: phosphoribosylaminoimidazolesuccinocarboxamide synthase [Dehalococcoidia bacterium]|nr:phosphoribosylaminoimidazolesuccinocarboxamide synthase [Dehalococcoidia bacterium]
MTVLVRTDLPTANLFHRGKVRDTYDLGDRLLMVATDRISAFDVVLPNGIPDKGHVLTQLSAFWFDLTANVAPNHFLRLIDSSEAKDVPFTIPPELVGRSMLIRKAKRLDVECVARGYLAGSGWVEYRATGKVCGIRLPSGLQESDELPEPIFTPSTKAETGHDINISFDQVVEIVGEKAASLIRDRTLAVYAFARDYARRRGIIIADTKLEFGWLPAEGGSASGGSDELIVIDELLTPDSSRFWPADGYQPGRSQPSFDKQPVRDWLESIGWNKQPPPPGLTPEVVKSTAERYREAFRRLMGREIMGPR